MKDEASIFSIFLILFILALGVVLWLNLGKIREGGSLPKTTLLPVNILSYDSRFLSQRIGIKYEFDGFVYPRDDSPSPYILYNNAPTYTLKVSAGETLTAVRYDVRADKQVGKILQHTFTDEEVDNAKAAYILDGNIVMDKDFIPKFYLRFVIPSPGGWPSSKSVMTIYSNGKRSCPVDVAMYLSDSLPQTTTIMPGGGFAWVGQTWSVKDQNDNVIGSATITDVEQTVVVITPTSVLLSTS